MAQSYQNLIPAHPRFPLTHLPSPLQRAERLERALRSEGNASVPALYLKRDDLLSLAMGGNKIRNLEFLIGEALAQGATDVITAGRQQSNHCRLTPAACAKAGLVAHLVLNGEAPSVTSGNLRLDEVLGADIVYTGGDDRGLRQQQIDALAAMLRERGRTPYVIPVGGSDVRGALGHVLAAGELVKQCDAAGIQPAAIVLATATGGTQAGMVMGLRKLGRPIPVIGFVVARTAGELAAEIASLCAGLADELGVEAPSSVDIVVDGRALGAGYGEPTAEGEAAVALLARTEGVLADPVYTGKGLAGLLSLVREGAYGENDALVFIHTGGAPALFA